MSAAIVVVLVSIGLVLLLISLLPIRSILKMGNTGNIRSGWMALTGAVFVFIAGYAAFGFMHIATEAKTADVVVAFVLFLGACFVLSIALLSRQTAADVLRIATLERDVFTDALTGLFNRRYLSVRLQDETARACRYGLDLSVLIIDIDHFKRINDTYGHQAGDEVLRGVCILVSQSCRPSDTVIRYGGEEILVVGPNTDIEAACYLAERIRATIEALETRIGDQTLIRVTASIGVSSKLNSEDSSGPFIERADSALYQAKQQGRNRVCRSTVKICRERENA